MKNILKKTTAVLLALVTLFVMLPVSALADGVGEVGAAIKDLATTLTDDGYIELSDGYITVRVSKDNGGFYVGTGEGDALSKSDNNADLTFSDGEFDTSFTSFRIIRDGVRSDYVFGRDYSRLGVATSKVEVYKSADNAIVAEWTVDGILIRQTVALMGADSYQHGMIYVSYVATNTSERAVDSVEARVMMDTSLGMTDYAYYMLAQNDGSYTAIETEQTVDGSAYSNYFFAYDSKTSPTVTAYTLNASVNGEVIAPERVTFAHWANLASTVFDYTPAGLNFTDPLADRNLLTADSAVALYYGMGGAEASSEIGAVGVYYGVYSNYNAGDADVSLNFTGSGTMFFDETETAYKDQNGKLPGNFSTTLKIQNTASDTIGKLAVAIYPEEELYPHDEGSGFVTDISATNPYYKVIEDLKPGESRDVRFDFQIAPTFVTSYRRIKIVIYNITAQAKLEDANTVLEEETFVLCPGAEGMEIGFTGMTPASIFVKGKRFAYITGTNFGLIRDKSQYRIVLRPMDGGADVVLDQDKVVVNPEKNTATLVLDMELRPVTYEVIIDWNDVTVEDMRSEALRLVVTDVPSPDDPGYVSSGVYGIITVERNGRSYDIVSYESEQALKESATEVKDIMLVLRGDFNLLSSEEQGNFKAEAITLMEGDIININETLDVKNGRVTVTKNFDENGNQTEITVDVEGKVYTTKANTKIWDGILAITSFEEGELYTLPLYDEQGEFSFYHGEEGGKKITLLWPGAASGAQTILGMLLSFRYGEFALMKQGEETARVIAFGASLDPSLLVPSGRHGTDAHYSELEQKQLEMGVSAYTAAQLRANDTKYAKSQAKWRASQAGTLNLYMDHILFGSGGFIGFNAAIDVGIPAYVDGLPYIQGTLEMKIINDYWEFGVEGKADVMLFEMEASLKFKSYDMIPIPDEISFFIGGVKPGVPVDPFGVFWIRGLGAGIYNIYDTFFGSDLLPPLMLTLTGEFAVFSVLSAKATVAISAQSFGMELEDVGIAGITVIDRIGGSIRWYPKFGISFGITVNILDCITGEGSIVAREEENGGFYFCGYARVTVQIPDKIWFIGGLRIGHAELGIDTYKVWASVSVLGLGVGIKYYWSSGEVDFNLGDSYDVPQPRMMNLRKMPVLADPTTGEVLYMDVTNAIYDLSETAINSSQSGQYHSFSLDSTVKQDGLLVLTYDAPNALAAADYRDAITVTVEGEKYALEWFNRDYEADHEANIGTNAIYQYDSESGVATVTVSFTDEASFDSIIEVESEAGTTAALYGIDRIAEIDSVAVNGDLTSATVTGSMLNELSALGIYAENENGELYLLGEADVTAIGESGGEIAIAIPSNMQSGSYKIKAIGTFCDESGEEIASPTAECEIAYENTNQPKAPTLATLRLSGNYTVTLETDSYERYDGYLTGIYEVTADGYVPTVFSEMITEIKAEDPVRTDILLGGRYSETDENGVTVYKGLEAGKKYAVSVQAYVNNDDGTRLLSTPVISNEIMMVMPTACDPVFSIDGAREVSFGTLDATVSAVNRSSFTLNISGVGNLLSGYYKLGSGESAGWDAEAGEVIRTEQVYDWDGGNVEFTDLADGSYYLTVGGVTETHDQFKKQYAFTVDTEAPGILVSSPQGGGFFSGSSTQVSGIAEAGAKIEIRVEGGEATVIYADGNGAFSGTVELDESMAYQDITIYAVDGAGNRSMPFGCTLTNSLLGNEDLKAVILYRGREVTELISGYDEKQLTMAFKTEGRYITLNDGSAAKSRISWNTQIINGKTATVSKNGVFSGDSGAEGIVTATLEGKTATAVLIPVDLATVNVMLDVTAEGFVYDGTEKKPAVKVLSDGETITEGVDFTVSYLNNVDVGTATAVITATEDGKCIGARLVTFEITALPISEAEVALSNGDSKDKPKVTLTYNGTELTEGRDYTAEYAVSPDGGEGIVTVSGIGNYSGIFSERFEIKSFDHAVWLIPVITAVVLGGAALTLFLLKKKRKNKG